MYWGKKSRGNWAVTFLFLQISYKSDRHFALYCNFVPEQSLASVFSLDCGALQETWWLLPSIQTQLSNFNILSAEK